MNSLDSSTAALLRLSARITGGTEQDVRDGLVECRAEGAGEQWVEELVLQSYLFAGFPRALNAAREWRKLAAGEQHHGRSREPVAGSSQLQGYENTFAWRLSGEATCETVYGAMYDKLRANIRGLHPALDEWMIVEGYGKVLSRPGLDLARRELCIVAACVAAGQERQLHSHLHGARNAGVSDPVIEAALRALSGVVSVESLSSAHLLWKRVKGK